MLHLVAQIGYKDKITLIISDSLNLSNFGMKIEHKTLLVRKAEGKQHETRNCNCKTIQIR